MTPTDEALQVLAAHLKKKNDVAGMALLSKLLDAIIEKNRWTLDTLRAALSKMKSRDDRRAEYRLTPSVETGVPDDTRGRSSADKSNSRPG